MKNKVKECLLKGWSLKKTSWHLCLDNKTILKLAKQLLDKENK